MLPSGYLFGTSRSYIYIQCGGADGVDGDGVKITSPSELIYEYLNHDFSEESMPTVTRMCQYLFGTFLP